MTENQFQPGDVVYHKANNLRMVVMSVKENSIHTCFVIPNGIYKYDSFAPIELSKKPIKEDERYDPIVIYQLEEKKSS